MEARLVRYADDFVVLCKGQTERILAGIGGVLGSMGLTLNAEKTRVLDGREESFTFLGFRVLAVKHPRTGRMFALTRPGKKALAQIRAEVKSQTVRGTLALPAEAVIRRLNERIRGWVGYFYYGNCSRDLKSLKRFVEQRVRIYLRRKHRIKSWGYEAFPDAYLYRHLGLYKIPTTAPWTQAAKATGRR